MSRGRLAAILTGVLGGALSGFAVLRYRRDLRRARRRVETGSRIADTPYGPVEYAVAGEGPPLLLVHGAGGGFDQALYVARPLGQSFRLIAMSRFGYLRTPLPADASPEAQADAHAALLDALGIRQVSVVGASAGASSALQLALRHPERVAAVVLVVPAVYPFQLKRLPGGAAPERTSARTRLLMDTALRSDFLFWAACRLARGPMCRGILATPPDVVDAASAEEQERIAGILEHILPLSHRRLGLLNDAAVLSALPPYDLERVAAPTLILSVDDDLFRTRDGARYTADHVPGARLVQYPTGGHLWAGHQAEIMGEIAAFIGAAA